MNRMPSDSYVLLAAAALLTCSCGLSLTPHKTADVPVDTASPSPSPSLSAVPDPGPTASLSGTIHGQPAAFSYAVLKTDTAGYAALQFLDYDPCLWGENHTLSILPQQVFPQNFNTLVVSLLSPNAQPGSGVYGYTADPNDPAGYSLDPNSAFGTVEACKGTWSTITNGTSVTVHNISTDTGVAAGNITVTLADGSSLSGTFSTAACGGWNSQEGPADNPNYCAALR